MRFWILPYRKKRRPPNSIASLPRRRNVLEYETCCFRFRKSKKVIKRNSKESKKKGFLEPKTDISYQDALILAAKKEKAAFRLYTKLSDLAQDTELKQLFAALAQEEAKHKLRFEVEYDDFILEEN